MALDPKVGGVISELSLASTICPTTNEGQADLATSDLRGYIQRAYLNGRPTEERLGQAQGSSSRPREQGTARWCE